jgi:hypothetical protein
MFEPTRPTDAPDLLRVSEFQRHLQEWIATASPAGRVTRVPPSGHALVADLRQPQTAHGHEALEVLAACVRHGRRVTVHLRCGDFVLPLTVCPPEQRVLCRADLLDHLFGHLDSVTLLMVEPALVRPPAEDDPPTPGPALHHPLGPVLWQLAIRGLRATLLPEIAGPAAYRVAPGLDTTGFALPNAEAAAVYRLRRESATLRTVSQWPGFDRDRAARLLNALYLQAGLIVSRSHPSARRESWFGSLGSG